MNVFLGFIVGFLAVRCLYVACRSLLEAPALQRKNYRDYELPTGGGILLVLTLLLIEAGRACFGALGVGENSGLSVTRFLMLFAAFGFALLGLLDDLVGDGDARGFHGHLRALMSGRLTTGMLKVFGGLGLSVVLVAAPGFASGRRLIIDALIIALAANLGNLLDLAPGRVIKWSLLVYVGLAFVAGTTATGVAIAPIMGAALGLLPDDLREHLMLGDSGANILGGVLGVGAVLTLGEHGRLVLLVVLIAANALSEVISFSKIITAVPPLRWFDQLGRIKATPRNLT